MKSADLVPDNGNCNSLMDDEIDVVGVVGVTGDITELFEPTADSLLELNKTSTGIGYKDICFAMTTTNRKLNWKYRLYNTNHIKRLRVREF